jgi:hypothetical protein
MLEAAMRFGAELAVLTGLTSVLLAVVLAIVLRSMRRSPDKRELKRRLEVNRYGRLGDAFITEATETTIYYEYSVHGVHYTASQDVSGLRNWLPIQPERLIGFANLKYAVRNPANSILLCEEWSGLRVPARMAG